MDLTHATSTRSRWPIVAAMVAACSGCAAAPASPPFQLVGVRHVGLWTAADRDALARINMTGTDLGVCFPATLPDGRQRLVFVFGDTLTTGEPFTGRWDEDSIATAPMRWTDRDHMPELAWMTRSDGEFLSLIVPGEDLRGMEVSLDGVQVDGRTFVFLNAGWHTQPIHEHTDLICAEAPGGDFSRLELRFKQRTDRFLNVSVSLDPHDPTTAWIFGTGSYRKSPIYLAKAPASALDDFDAWRFWRGAGEWFADEQALAEPLIADIEAGELSVRFVDAAGCWVMAYQRRRSDARGQAVHLRFAPHPTGPWSDELTIIEPDIERGEAYTRFIHARESVAGFDDGLADPDRENKWGDPYGFYLVPQWCRSDDERVTLAATLSTWNPYQVSLVEVELAPVNVALPEPPAAADFESAPLPPFVRWVAEGDAFTMQKIDGEVWLTTLGRAGEATRGVRGVKVTVPAGARWLTFQIRGGRAAARLYDHHGRLVRESRGRADADPRLAAWRVDHLAGRTVRFTLEDHLEDPWGWAAVTQPRFTANRPRD